MLLNRKSVFVAGICSGAFVAVRWRTVLKRGLQWSLDASERLKVLAVRGAENVSDVLYEVQSERADGRLRPIATSDVALNGHVSPPTERATSTSAY
ncbi:MAG: hypothetical protein ACRDZ8_13535 [Acidimicrobiales bacterium]